MGEGHGRVMAWCFACGVVRSRVGLLVASEQVTQHKQQ